MNVRRMLGVVIAICACGGSGARNGPDGGSLTGPDAGEVSVTVLTPAEGQRVGAQVAIEAAVSGGTPSQVSLWLDGSTPLATFTSAPYRYTWDASAAPAGNHRVVAHAVVDGKDVASAERTFVLDNARPEVVAIEPTNTPSVCPTDSFVVHFSEALDPVSLQGSSPLTITREDGGVEGTAWTLSADGTTLTVSLATPGERIPDSQSALSAFPSAQLTDLVGNPLLLPAAPAQWRLDPWCTNRSPGEPFSVGNLDFPSLAVDQAGHPFLAGLRHDASVVNAYVFRWSGTDWVPVGGAINPVAGQNAGAVAGDPYFAPPAVAIDSAGNPWVALYESDGSRLSLFVMRWSGSAWTPIGGAINPNAGDLHTSSGLNGIGKVAFALDSHDQAYVAVASVPSAANAARLYLMKYSSGGWALQGGSQSIETTDTHSVELPRLVIDASDRPTVAFAQAVGSTVYSPYVLRFDPGTGTWSQPGGSSVVNLTNEAVQNLDLAVAPDGTLYVGMVEYDVSVTHRSDWIAYLGPTAANWWEYGSVNVTQPPTGDVASVFGMAVAPVMPSGYPEVGTAFFSTGGTASEYVARGPTGNGQVEPSVAPLPVAPWVRTPGVAFDSTARQYTAIVQPVDGGTPATFVEHRYSE